MNIFGMGTLEILVVLLAAFIFLGPERMANVAKLLGRVTGEVRRLTAELSRLDLGVDHPADGPSDRTNTPDAGFPRIDSSTPVERISKEEISSNTQNNAVEFRPAIEVVKDEEAGPHSDEESV